MTCVKSTAAVVAVETIVEDLEADLKDVKQEVDAAQGMPARKCNSDSHVISNIVSLRSLVLSC